MYYVQETDKPNYVFKLFNVIKLEDDKIILPVQNQEINLKRAEKLAEKTKKILDKTNCNKIILSQEIKKQENYKNCLYSNQINIVDGKWLFEILSYQAIEYVIKKQNIKKDETTVSILVNDISNNILENIRKIVKEFKRVNIVTNHIEKFKNIESQILEKEGIMITVTNNKKKSLSKSKIILNVDFPTELINRFNIYEEAIIINLKGNVRINKKRFNGININDYEIDFTDSGDFDCDKNTLYDKKDIYEAQIFQNKPFKYIQERINKDKVKIIEMKGNKTII